MKPIHARMIRGALAGSVAIGLISSATGPAVAAKPPRPSTATTTSGAYNPEATSPAVLSGVQTKWRTQPKQDDTHSCATVKQRATALSLQRHAAGALVACGDLRTAPTRTLSTIGLGDDPGNDPMPNGCDTPGSKIVGRFADCQVGLIEYELWTVPTNGEPPKLVGEAAIGVGSMTRGDRPKHRP
jgi:hypothetical protein